jgi:ABC-type Mn2+/Zn2+ transport system permease subunit
MILPPAILADGLMNSPALRAGVVAGAVGIAGAVVSIFVVLRQWAYLGDGIAHAGFGGVGTALLLSAAFPVLNNAAAISLIGSISILATAMAVAWVSRRGAVSGDAAVGIFVTATLAWGLIAFSIHEQSGRGGAGGWELYLIGDLSRLSPQDMLLGFGISTAVVLVVWGLFRQIVLYCFDPTLAQVTGIPVGFVHYLLMLLVGMVILVGVRLAGFLLAPALVIVPGAIALAISRNMRTVLVVAIVSSLLANFAGVLVGMHWAYIKPGPAIVGILFVEFLAAHFYRLLSPNS